MARICELTGKRFLSGNKVSHSKRHTKKRFFPNLHQRRLYSEVFSRAFRLKVSNSAVRTVMFKNGLDNFLLSHNSIKAKARFSIKVYRLYRNLQKKILKYASQSVEIKKTDNVDTV
ncbi:MAG: 50S ribosomal protein L28 [Pseudomonadota bacterium]